jgi:hypothetical protein
MDWNDNVICDNWDNRSVREKILDSFNYIPLSAMFGSFEKPKEMKGKSFESLIGAEDDE